MKYSDWRYEINLHELGNFANAAVNTLRLGNEVARTGIEKAKVVGAAARKIGKAVSGRQKTDSQKRIIKTGGIKAARDMDGDGKLERKRRGGDFQETLLYDVVHDYIISENFASDTEGANKVMLKLSDELMQEIYERMMTASEKRKDTMLKKKYDDSDMKKNMQAQYGKEEGKKVYFATIRKQAMKKEEVEVVDEAKYEKGASDYGKTSIRNKRAFGKGGNARPPEERGAAKMLRHDAHQKRRFVKKNNKYGATNKPPVYGAPSDEFKKNRYVTKEEVGISSTVMRDKAKKEAMLRMKEREAVAKKLRKEEMSNGDKVVKMAKAVTDEKKRKNALQIQKYIGEVKRDEYGDPVGGPKISKKEKEKNLKKNTPDEQHTTTTSEGYGSDRVGPALTMARVIDKVNPRPKPTSKRTRVSRALKMASIKKDEKIRKRQENPYSADKRLKMVATSIRDRVKQKAKAMTTREDYIPEEGYDIARDMGRVPKTKDKKDATTMPPSEEMKKTQKVYKGPSALELVKKKYGKAIMDVKKK